MAATAPWRPACCVPLQPGRSGPRPYPTSRVQSKPANEGWGAELVQQSEDGRVVDGRAEDAFQVRVDLGEQATQSVADASGLAGQVVVEVNDPLQLEGAAGQGLVEPADREMRAESSVY